MYTVSDIAEIGDAHELVLSTIKDEWVLDDSAPQSMPLEEYFDE